MSPLIGRTIMVAGAGGMVGRALVRASMAAGAAVLAPLRAQLDLADSAAVTAYLGAHRPDAVIMAAGHVGGIIANAAEPDRFFADNFQLAESVIGAAEAAGIARLVYLGSTCIYPKAAPQPLREETVRDGAPEPTNAGYAMAKRAGLGMVAQCRARGLGYISVLPTNLYGPYDRFDAYRAHVVPALMAKAQRAAAERLAVLAIGGSGTPLRDFLHVDDCAEAILACLTDYDDGTPINIGSGTDTTIAALAEMVCDVAGFEGAIAFDAALPDGIARKSLDLARISALGWRPRISLRGGIEATYRWYCDHHLRAAA